MVSRPKVLKDADVIANHISEMKSLYFSDLSFDDVHNAASFEDFSALFSYLKDVSDKELDNVSVDLEPRVITAVLSFVFMKHKALTSLDDVREMLFKHSQYRSFVGSMEKYVSDIVLFPAYWWLFEDSPELLSENMLVWVQKVKERISHLKVQDNLSDFAHLHRLRKRESFIPILPITDLLAKIIVSEKESIVVTNNYDKLSACNGYVDIFEESVGVDMFEYQRKYGRMSDTHKSMLLLNVLVYAHVWSKNSCVSDALNEVIALPGVQITLFERGFVDVEKNTVLFPALWWLLEDYPSALDDNQKKTAKLIFVQLADMNIENYFLRGGNSENKSFAEILGEQ